MGFYWGKIEASGLICNLNLSITKFQFRFHNITNACVPKFLKAKKKKGPNLDDKFREKGVGIKKPMLLSLSLEINH